MNAAARQHQITRQLLAGWCGLLLYVGVATPLGPAIVAFLGSLDTSHQVQVCCGSNGPQVVLHHTGGGMPHEHGCMARALTLLARPANGANPDHVLQFDSTVPALTTSGTMLSLQDSVSAPLASIEAMFPQPGEVAAVPPPPRPPPDTGGAPLCRYSTVLRI